MVTSDHVCDGVWSSISQFTLKLQEAVFPQLFQMPLVNKPVAETRVGWKVQCLKWLN